MNKTDTQQPLVSCIIPSYKRSDSVARAIDSVLNQSYQNIEVCVVDDNNPGDEHSLNLHSLLKKYSDDCRVRCITQASHINGAAARNAGIKEANGEYVAFLDDDDEWMPDKIKKQMECLLEKECDAVTSLWSLNCNDKEIRKCPPYTADNLQLKVFLREVAVFTSTLLIKKERILEFGGFDEELLRHQDLQFLIDSLEHCKYGVIQEYLVKLHIDSDINRPNVNKLIEAKSAFFKSVESIFDKYSKRDKRRILNAHNFEIIFHALKSKKIGIALKYFFKVKPSFKSLQDLYRRYKSR